MPTDFPGAVDTFPNPTSTTNTDDAGFELDVVISDLGDALEAVEDYVLDPANFGAGGDTLYLPDSTGAYGLPGAVATDGQGAISLPTSSRTMYGFFTVNEPLTITESYAAVSSAVASSVVYVGVVRLDPVTRQPTSDGLIGQTSFTADTTGAKVITGLDWDLQPGLYATVYSASIPTVILRGQYFHIPGLSFGFEGDSVFSTVVSMRNSHTSGGGPWSNPVVPWQSDQRGPMYGSGFYHAILFKWSVTV